MPSPSYNRLTAALNRLFPERLTLAVGCQLRSFSRHNELGRCRPADRSVDERGGTFTLVAQTTNNEGWLFAHSCGFGTVWENEIYEPRLEIEILGPEPTLAEVLRAIDDKEKVFLSGLDETTGPGTFELNGIRIDLSIPVSRWPDDVLDAVAGMMG